MHACGSRRGRVNQHKHTQMITHAHGLELATPRYDGWPDGLLQTKMNQHLRSSGPNKRKISKCSLKQLLCFEWSPPWHFKTACWHHFCLKLLSRDFCPTNYPNHLFQNNNLLLLNSSMMMSILPLARDRVDEGSNAPTNVPMSHIHHATIALIHNRNPVWCWLSQASIQHEITSSNL